MSDSIVESALDDNEGAYFMVPVSETVTASYPVLANSEAEARERVQELLISGELTSPRMRPSHVSEPSLAVSDPVEASSEMCSYLASKALSEREADILLKGAVRTRTSNLTPTEVSRAARQSLSRTGSGALQPSKRRRM